MTGYESLRPLMAPGRCETRSLAERSAEHRLMLAVLEDAIGIFVKSMFGGVVKQSEVRDARAWFNSRDRSLPFDYESVCDVLGFDSDYIRRGLLELRAAPAEPAYGLARLNHGHAPGPAKGTQIRSLPKER